MNRGLSAGTILFWLVLLVTVAVWILRGLALLSFIPGAVLWILILLSISTGLLSQRRRFRRWR